MAKIQRALLSCYDKTGVVELGRLLHDFGVEIIGTAGTLEALREGGIEATGIADLTGVEEMLSGRLKSLHPIVHAGLLGVRDDKVHQEQMQAHDYQWIDFVAVNLHPIEELTCRPGVTVQEVVEQVDIGGTAMIRSAAKSFRYVSVVVSPARYGAVIHELRERDGELSFATRYRLAEEAFETIAEYDQSIASYLKASEPPKE